MQNTNALNRACFNLQVPDSSTRFEIRAVEKSGLSHKARSTRDTQSSEQWLRKLGAAKPCRRHMQQPHITLVGPSSAAGLPAAHIPSKKTACCLYLAKNPVGGSGRQEAGRGRNWRGLRQKRRTGWQGRYHRRRVRSSSQRPSPQHYRI